MIEPWKGFVFLDVNDDLLTEKHDLGFGLTLRKAEPGEISDKNVDYSFRPWPERRGTSVCINQRMPLEGENNQPQGSIIPNPEMWRHAVIDCADNDVYFRNVN